MNRPQRSRGLRLGAALSRPHRRLRARVDGSDRGAVLPIVALFIVVLVLATSLAVDIGRLSNRNRDLQKVADLVSLDAVRAIGSSTSANLVTTGGSFLATVQDSAANNGFPVTCVTSSTSPNYEATCSQTGARDTLTVDLGFWCTPASTSTGCAGATVPAGKPGVLVYDTAGTNVPTAVQIRAGDFVKYYFGMGLVNGQSATRLGSASLDATADFGLGTSLANLDSAQSSLLGPLLNGLLGFNLNSQVVGWQGLANANLTLGALASNLGLALGSPSSLLDSNVTLVQFVNAAAAAFSSSGDLADASLLSLIATNIPNPLRSQTLTLGDLFDISTSDIGAALSSSVNVLQLISAAAQVANGANSVAINSSGISVPGGLATIGGVSVHITQPVKFKYHAHVGDTLEAGQATLSVNVLNISTAPVTSLLGTLLGSLLGLSVTVGPATLTTGVANGQATLTAVSCSSTPAFTLGVSSGLASLTMNLPITASAVVLGIRVPLIGGSLVATQSQDNKTRNVTFAFGPDTPGEAKDAGGGSLFWNSPPNVSSSNLTLAGIVPAGQLVAGLTSGLVVPLLDDINSLIIQPLQSLLGLTVADATVFAGQSDPPVHCNTPELVQ